MISMSSQARALHLMIISTPGVAMLTSALNFSNYLLSSLLLSIF